MTKYKRLTYDDRLKIEALYKAKIPVKQIANYLCRSYKTIYCELKKGMYTMLDAKTYTPVMSYSADVGQIKADKQKVERGACPKIGCRHDICRLIAHWILDCGYSPAVCSQCLQRGDYGITLCTTTIYTYIIKGYIPDVTIYQCPYGSIRKNPKKRKITRRKRAAAGVSIEMRPDVVNERSEFGHWEMDCIIGKANGTKQALLTLTERKTRYEIVMRLHRKDTCSVVQALDKIQRRIGLSFASVFKSITVDNGCEFADCCGMEYDKNGNRRTSIYYCHPYCSSERGTNERHNRMLRKYWVKGASLNKVTQNDCDEIADKLNTYPRKILNWNTPAELFVCEMKFILSAWGHIGVCPRRKKSL